MQQPWQASVATHPKHIIELVGFEKPYSNSTYANGQPN
jgi:hypothetical protein